MTGKIEQMKREVELKVEGALTRVDFTEERGVSWQEYASLKEARCFGRVGFSDRRGGGGGQVRVGFTEGREVSWPVYALLKEIR